MVISNVGFYPCRTKLCVRQILQRGDPQFLPPPRYDTYDRYDYDIQENSFVSDNWATKWATLTRYIQFLANVHWVLLKVVSDFELNLVNISKIISSNIKIRISNIISLLYFLYSITFSYVQFQISFSE